MPFLGLLLCHTGLISVSKRRHLLWLLVGKSSSTSQQLPCSLCQFRGDPWWGWQHCLWPGQGNCCGVVGDTLQSQAVSMKNITLSSSHQPLCFHIASQERMEKNAFRPWLMYCSITYCTIFQYNRSQSSAAFKMPLKSFFKAWTEVTYLKKKAWKTGSLWFGLPLCSFLCLKDNCSCYPSVKVWTEE